MIVTKMLRRLLKYHANNFVVSYMDLSTFGVNLQQF